MWSTSHIACIAINKLKNGDHNETANKVNLSPYVGLVAAKRFVRSSNFDRGYEEFLRNYHDDYKGKYVHQSEYITVLTSFFYILIIIKVVGIIDIRQKVRQKEVMKMMGAT